MTTSEVDIEKDEINRIFLGFALEAQKQIKSTLPRPKKKVIVIAGPTGTGKSHFAMGLARSIGGEIISADSMQVYRGMDIGTAKPTVEERLEIPHHLIDIRDIKESFNVVDFYYEAKHACQVILARDNVPIIVGGAGFYLHSLLYGPPSGPPSVPEVRQKLEEEMKELGADVLYNRLFEQDPSYARTITKNDKQKIVRALEIMVLSGKKVSKLAWKSKKKQLNYDFRCWFLHRPRERLYHRIEKRCDQMLEDGFLDEVIRLEKMGLKENTSASQAIGYRQALDFLGTCQTEKDYHKFVQSFKQASRNYAKRQRTWFAKESLFNWIDMDIHDYEIIREMIMRDYETSL